MLINTNFSQSSYNNFCGCDARKLKGFIVGTNMGNFADKMVTIGEKENFKVYRISDPIVTKPFLGLNNVKESIFVWAQDTWTIINNKVFAPHYYCRDVDLAVDTKRTTDAIAEHLHLKHGHYPKAIDSFSMGKADPTHIPGGNIFFIRGEQGEEIIVGQDELEKYTAQEIKEIYEAKKITVLPQMDYHLDLFIRPLDKKRILLADDNLTLDLLNKELDKINKQKKYYFSHMKIFEGNECNYLKSFYNNIIKEFEIAIKQNTKPQADEIAKILNDSGYEVIRVPGRLYDVEHYNKYLSLTHFFNFMNANVIKNDNDELIYIANKSYQYVGIEDSIKKFPKLFRSFEEIFSDTIAEYINKKHLYFIGNEDNQLAETLLKFHGSGHCMCAEVPA